MTSVAISTFQNIVLDHYDQHGRHELPWRLPEADGTFSAYKITVSELMLQQTQVSRVIPKYQAFLAAFPTVQDLARAPLGAVLTIWSGLGYNRRAKFLWQTAQAVVKSYNGAFPDTKTELVRLPGIGPNTAGAILAYANNQPSIFIETNVRTVFIHHFFTGQEAVADADILPLVARAVPEESSRIWYWALMDYGTFVKRQVGNVARASASYTKQSAFHGSRRQVRGHILRLFITGPRTIAYLADALADDRIIEVVDDLCKEGLIENKAGTYRLRMV